MFTHLGSFLLDYHILSDFLELLPPHMVVERIQDRSYIGTFVEDGNHNVDFCHHELKLLEAAVS